LVSSAGVLAIVGGGGEAAVEAGDFCDKCSCGILGAAGDAGTEEAGTVDSGAVGFAAPPDVTGVFTTDAGVSAFLWGADGGAVAVPAVGGATDNFGSAAAAGADVSIPTSYGEENQSSGGNAMPQTLPGTSNSSPI
jgi:hypothetical protein